MLCAIFARMRVVYACVQCFVFAVFAVFTIFIVFFVFVFFPLYCLDDKMLGLVFRERSYREKGLAQNADNFYVRPCLMVRVRS